MKANQTENIKNAVREEVYKATRSLYKAVRLALELNRQGQILDPKAVEQLENAVKEGNGVAWHVGIK